MLIGLSFLIFMPSCQGGTVPDGRILIKNDSQDREFNVINVATSGLSKYLKPGESVLLPSGARNFSISRRYRDHTKSYSVQCPPVKGRGLFIKTIDVHLNRIVGGCKTVSASR